MRGGARGMNKAGASCGGKRGARERRAVALDGAHEGVCRGVNVKGCCCCCPDSPWSKAECQSGAGTLLHSVACPTRDLITTVWPY
jgi:hypothetical protein